VAKQKRKPARGKPITSHQLFPAVVALWFGALFGLGSLAVRPSLLERLVLASQIDLVVPAAAPPLGVTARVMVALSLTALGAIMGFVIARRIARAKPVETGRERTEGEPVGGEVPLHPRQGRAKGASPQDLADAGSEPVAESAPITRRRALAIDPEGAAFMPLDLAPLPGGPPQIFDISKLRLDEDEPAHEAAEWPASCPDTTAAAYADGRQVFGMVPPDPQPETARQIFETADAKDPVQEPCPPVTGEQPQPDPAALDMPELAARLAASMQRRRAARAESAAGVAHELPRPLSPQASNAGPDHDVHADEEPSDEPIREEDFGSLLGIASARNALRRAAGSEPAQTDIEPVVIFPGQPATTGHDHPFIGSSSSVLDPTEAESALRAALANLQRLSGAA
jgi:hypothetical protein